MIGQRNRQPNRDYNFIHKDIYTTILLQNNIKYSWSCLDIVFLFHSFKGSTVQDHKEVYLYNKNKKEKKTKNKHNNNKKEK